MRAIYLALLCAACSSAGTETVVVVSAGDVIVPADVDKVLVVVENTMAGSPDLPLCTGTSRSSGCLTLPIVATLVPGPDRPSDQVTVNVTAYHNGQPVIRDGASFVFQTGQQDRIDFVLSKSCLGSLTCAGMMPPESCDADGTCAPLLVAPLGPHPIFDAGMSAPPDLASSSDLMSAVDLLSMPDLMTPADLLTPDLQPEPGFSTDPCVSADQISASGGFPGATCNAYCASLGKACSNTSCITNRGFGTFGVEAWTTAADCASYVPSSGQAFCTDDLSGFSDPDLTKYRCCCI